MAQIKQYTITEPYLNIKCKLGEGPHYNEKLKEFRFLDIDGKQIHFIDVTKGASSHRVLDHPAFSIGVTADIVGNDDEIAIAAETFFGTINRQSGKHRVLKEFWGDGPQAESKAKERRMNDGNVDVQGRFFAGTMTDPRKKDDWLQPDNPLFRFDTNHSTHQMLQGATIPNGISWTHDNKTMYWTDSPVGIYKFDYSPETGAMSNQTTFFKWTPSKEGEREVCDGHAMDVEEHLWIAICGAGKVVRVNPKAEVVAEVSVPAKMVTCPCFVGEDLYITSIGSGGQYPGALFKIHVGIQGRKKYEIKLQS